MLGTLPVRYWGYYGTCRGEKSLRSVIKRLDERGVKEGVLKGHLKEAMEMSSSTNTVEQNQSLSSTIMANGETICYRTSGDEEAFQQAVSEYRASICEDDNEENGNDTSDNDDVMVTLASLTSVIGQHVRVRRAVDPASTSSVAKYDNGTVISWYQTAIKMNGNVHDDDKDNAANHNHTKWQIKLDRGGYTLPLSGHELCASLGRHLTFTRSNYEIEPDVSYLCYKNTVGRFTGRAQDAPLSSTPEFFTRYLLKKEAEYFKQLKYYKCVGVEDTWGGKSGARNAWMGHLKEFGHDFVTVKEALLTLENAFFELMGGWRDQDEDNNNSPPEQDISGKEILNNQILRFDIELESLMPIDGMTMAAPTGLWNSREARPVFLEIMQSCTSVGFLALGLDLICRNCDAYLATAKELARPSKSPVYQSYIGTRRQNAWQQRN
eukprot:CAMPEP_0172499610 /NCGR_PEP_ID=MMETSP1066-20121228/128591_1 /TAXON_ID=671091 /ORGANISM="Coscinodiscus wailesii, Strain CCMP2513" /LENGTH=435 /DNA_ID=CAMNT_0013273427 /DNA_START=45 /DNA_END=1352 /DNA_ORIENTATION=+